MSNITISDIAEANKHPHNADGKAHFTYFDKETQLSFVWNGDFRSSIQVSHGGYGEPVFDLIDVNRDHLRVEMGPQSWIIWFGQVCQSYAEQFKNEGGGPTSNGG